MTEGFSSQAKLYETLSLPLPTGKLIARTLATISDTPQFAYYAKQDLCRSLRKRVRDGELQNTSLANLQTVNTLIGT